MMKLSKLKQKMMLSIVSIISVASLLLVAVFSTFAWYTINEKSFAKGINLSLKDNIPMSYEKRVYATRYIIDNTRVSNIYEINSKGVLILVSSTLFDELNPEGKDNTMNENSLFLFEEMVPGEYVDITFGYYFNDLSEEFKYKLELGNFSSSGIFELSANGETYTHSILGIFKFRPISLKTDYVDGSNSTVLEFNTLDYPFQWLTNYNAFKNDLVPNTIDLLKDPTISVFRKEYSRQEFTFRISEDLSQYYRLVNDSGTFATNLLSHLTFNIGSILLSPIDE